MASLRTPGLLWNDKWIPLARGYGDNVPTLQQLLLRYSDAIFPGHFVAPFELILSIDPQEEQAVADLTLVSKDYRSWHLLFVAPHLTMDREVLRANLVTAFLSPYGNREVTELKRQIEHLEEARAREMVADGPSFVIVTDYPRHRLDDEFGDLQVDIMVVEPFQLDGEFVFRINGKNPAQPAPEILALCHANPAFAGSLIMQWIALDEVPVEGAVGIKYEGTTTQWHAYPGETQRVLMPESGRSPLHEDPPFDLIKDADGNYALRQKIWEA